MRLFAILSFYDESPTWLAACVASMSRIGVDHVIAVDGAYLHFDGDARSPVEQADAIQLAAEGTGMGSTIVRPQDKRWTEPEKRTQCFRLLEALADRFVDWCIILDGDDLIIEGDTTFKAEIASTDHYAAMCKLSQTIDPFAAEGKHVNAKTAEIYQKLPSPTRFKQYQSRAWRVLRDMRVVGTHYSYVGRDAEGNVLNLRPDVGKCSVADAVPVEVYRPENMPLIEHRDPWRTRFRLQQKADYYDLRDRLGLERTGEAAVVTE